MPKPMNEQPPNVRLLTLINVDNAGKRALKRSQHSTRDWHQIAKRAKIVQATKQSFENSAADGAALSNQITAADETGKDDSDDEQQGQEQVDSFERHWSHDSHCVQDLTAEQLQQTKFKKRKTKLPGLGDVSSWFTSDEPTRLDGNLGIYNARLMEKLKQQPRSTKGKIQDILLNTLASYQDMFYPKMKLAEHDSFRSTLAMHAMNHVLRTRNRVLKNNEYLARLAADPDAAKTFAPRNTQDQGFTRPKVLVLVPFRNSALRWVHLLTSMSNADTIDGKARFDTEYSLPEGASDKLAENPENYAPDHVATFKGNIDDSFRIGLKVTRKTIKLFAEFYSCDLIVASPLGLRTSIEKEDDSDFLSSIEMLIVDQMDVLTMQNWDHVNFIMERMNKIPQDSHGCDFSRVKPWYLDGKSAYLRQSILMSAYETPEMRSMYSQHLHNVAGKIKAETTYDGVLSAVPRGIKQVFTRFDATDVYAEDDARFEKFKTKTLPMLLKSAVSSSQTMIFVPSYFDFVRLKRYLKSLPDFSFASISEYTPTPDVSRARGAFFAGKVAFLLVTERFHFFRRYRLRGAKTFVFYAPPDHADFYSEVVSFPFPRAGQDDDSPDVDPSELSCHVVFSKFDLLRLERIVGSPEARKMVTSGAEASRFTFLE